jgi:hypothetical protein
VEPSAITSITQVGSNVVIIFTNEVDLNAIGDVTVAGKFNI